MLLCIHNSRESKVTNLLFLLRGDGMRINVGVCVCVSVNCVKKAWRWRWRWSFSYLSSGVC